MHDCLELIVIQQWFPVVQDVHFLSAGEGGSLSCDTAMASGVAGGALAPRIAVHGCIAMAATVGVARGTLRTVSGCRVRGTSCNTTIGSFNIPKPLPEINNTLITTHAPGQVPPPTHHSLWKRPLRR